MTFAGGTATVATPWALPGSLVYLTNIAPAGTVRTPYVSMRGTGSFTVESTNGTDTGTIAWMIM